MGIANTSIATAKVKVWYMQKGTHGSDKNYYRLMQIKIYRQKPRKAIFTHWTGKKIKFIALDPIRPRLRRFGNKYVSTRRRYHDIKK